MYFSQLTIAIIGLLILGAINASYREGISYAKKYNEEQRQRDQNFEKHMKKNFEKLEHHENLM